VSGGVASGRAMTFGDESFARDGGPRRSANPVLPWGGALALGAVLALLAPPAPISVDAARPAVAVAPTPRPPRAVANPFGDLVAIDRQPINPYGALVEGFPDPDAAPLSAASSLQATIDVAPRRPAALPQPQDAPAPPLRPAAFAALATPAPAIRRPPPSSVAIAHVTAAPDGAVAYAAPDDQAGASAGSPALAAVDRATGSSSFARSSSPGLDSQTAVYDISAHTVTLPDGTKLEAHSGLGTRLDNPRFVAEHDRGATPPHLYDLALVEGLFHGVQALRLNPVGGDGSVFGRTGLLAHSYMLGPKGDSNGCVAFKNYDAFLRAYQQGRVKRLVVVARLD
jgi:hypothetical protein